MNFANGLGWPHLLIIAGVIVLLFGANKLPDMARSLGQSARILKAETKGMRGDEAAEQDPPAAPAGQSRGEIERLCARLAAAEHREQVAKAQLTGVDHEAPNGSAGHTDAT